MAGAKATTPLATAVTTTLAPAPAGTYSQAVRAGAYVFVSGQTPREPDGGERLPPDTPFDQQVTQVLNNLRAVCRAADSDLEQVVKVCVYLKDPALAPVFDAVYAQFFSGATLPARSVVQSSLLNASIEIDAVLYVG